MARKPWYSGPWKRVHVDTFVTLPEPPTHKCPKRANRVIQLQREEDNK